MGKKGVGPLNWVFLPSCFVAKQFLAYSYCAVCTLTGAIILSINIQEGLNIYQTVLTVSYMHLYDDIGDALFVVPSSIDI